MTKEHETDAPGQEVRQMRRKHVFVVNADPPLLDLVRELLTEQRYHVTTTNYVPETFDAIVGLNPNLLIVDLVYGQRTGWDLLERLTMGFATHNIPILLTSTNPDLLERAAADPARFGTNTDLIMPFDINDLIRVVSDLIGSA